MGVAGIDRPPPGAAADWTVEQNWASYTAEEHARWEQLFARQARQLNGRAAQAWLRGLDVLRLSDRGIPNFDELSDHLMRATGWRVVAVPGLVPDAVFFDHLANRRFVAGNFLRPANQMDYLQEPDVFHDVFGHVPMLADPVFADYMQAYGQGGLRSLEYGALDRLARLYWYTVEFGLVEEDGALRIYGSGIVSSHGESGFALDDPSPHRIGFDLMRVMRTRYRIDDYQQCYFVVPDFAALLRQTLETDFAPLYARLAGQTDIDPGDLVSSDRVIHRGTQKRAVTPLERA
jgi:phenylalanine-4-hydroxylase